MGRPPIGRQAMSNADRQRRFIERLKSRARDNITNDIDPHPQLISGLRKIVTGLHREGKKNMTPPGAVALLARELETLLRDHGIIPKRKMATK